MDSIRIGDRCTANGSLGHVRFVGPTSFAPGTWVGVELETSGGKNDGEVQGKRYFSCQPQHGVFVRAAKVVSLDRISDSTLNASVSTRESNVDQSARVFKVPQLPVADLTSSVSRTALSPLRRSSSYKSTTGQSSLPPLERTLSTNPPQSVGYSQSFDVMTMENSTRHPKIASSTSTVRRGTPNTENQRPTLVRKTSDSPHDHRSYSSSSPNNKHRSLVTEAPKQAYDHDGDGTIARSLSRSSVTSSLAVPPPLLHSNEIDQSDVDHGEIALDVLKGRIHALEVQRGLDVRKLSALSALESEKQAWNTIKSKLREKLQSQQVELKIMKERIQQLESLLAAQNAEVNSRDMIQESDERDLLEMAMLDREMAEEERDQLRAELEQIKSRNEELTLDVEILREQEDQDVARVPEFDIGDMRSVKLNNDRLREALVRLKQVCDEQDKDLRSVDAALKDKTALNEELTANLDLAQMRLAETESTVEVLNDRLDVLIGAEEMLESLTERNLALGEQLELCRAEITDLETLKTINDELEEDNHLAQTELIREIEAKNDIVIQQNSHIAQIEEKASEYAETISKFRTLVDRLQGEIAAIRTSGNKAVSETEGISQYARNLLTENNTLRAQRHRDVKQDFTILVRGHDIECAIEHLEIVSSYLPESYDTDKPAITAYLGIVGTGRLATLLSTFVADQLTSATLPNVLVHIPILQSASRLELMCEEVSLSFREISPENFTILGAKSSSVEDALLAMKGTVEQIQDPDYHPQAIAHRLEDIEGQLREAVSSFQLGEVTYKVLQSKVSWVQKALKLCSVIVLHTIQSLNSQDASEMEVISDAAEPTWRPLVTMQSDLAQLQTVTQACLKAITGLLLQAGHPSTSVALKAQDVVKNTSKIMTGLISCIKCFAMSNEAPDDSRPSSALDVISDLSVLNSFALDLHQQLLGALAASEMKSLNRMIPVPTPWVLRGAKLHASMLSVAEEQRKVDAISQESKELLHQLYIVQKAFEEEKIKTEALERQLSEKINIIRHLKVTEAENVSTGTSAYESTIKELNDQLALLKNSARNLPTGGALPNERQPAISTAQGTNEEEIHLLRETIRHLNEQIGTLREPVYAQEAQFLAKPLCNVEPIVRSSVSPKLCSALRSFTKSLKFVDYQKTPLTDFKWTPVREQCGYSHFVQEEHYAQLLGMQKH